MTTNATLNTTEIEGFRQIARFTGSCVNANLEGITQQESLAHPDAGGNCLNWVLGHLVYVYCNALPLLGQKAPLDPEAIERYKRGSAPLTSADKPMEIGELTAAWKEASKRFDQGLQSLPPESLDAKAPFSPSNDPNETVRSLLNTVLFHQAYHSGQTGVLRRLAGKPGAIK